MRVRDYERTTDRSAVRRLVVALQDFERSLDPKMPAGESIADEYLDLMLSRTAEYDGSVLVAEVDGSVVGFVTVWTRFRSSEPDDDPSEHGFVSDLIVDASSRGSGIGRRLLREAESRARRAGARYVRLAVKARNTAALSLYRQEGFSESDLYMEKPLPSSR